MLAYPPCPPLGSLVDSERVVLRKELASIIADNNRLEGIVLQLKADLAAKDAENGRLRSENGRLRSLAAAQQKALEGAGIKIKDMERRGAYHDNPNVPPSHRSPTLLEMRREDTEEERRRSRRGAGPAGQGAIQAPCQSWTRARRGGGQACLRRRVPRVPRDQPAAPEGPVQVGRRDRGYEKGKDARLPRPDVQQMRPRRQGP